MVIARQPERLLLVDPDATFAAFCREALLRNLFHECELIQVGTMTQARQQIGVVELDGVFVFEDLPDGSGMDLLTEIQQMTASERPATIYMTELDSSQQAVRAFKTGAQDYLSKLLMSGDALRAAVQGALERQNTVRETAKQQALYEHMALHDSLTGLANRSLFQNRLDHALQRAKRSKGTLAVMMIDLDGFKKINDTYGHEAGDAVLQEVGTRLQACLRGTDTLARLGGDEFAILLEGMATSEDAYYVIRRILAADDEPVMYHGSALPFGMSVGFAIYPDTADTAQDLLNVADQTMYQAKRSRAGCAYPKGFQPPAQKFGVHAIAAYRQ